MDFASVRITIDEGGRLDVLSFDDKSWWLSEIDFFFQDAIEECRFYVKMMKCPAGMCCDAKKELYGLPLDNAGKSFVVINAVPLLKASCHEKCFVTWGLFCTQRLEFEDSTCSNRSFFLAEERRDPMSHS